jgi:acetyl esterase
VGEDCVSAPADLGLDPDAQAARSAFIAAGIPPLESLSPAAARVLIEQMRARVAAKPQRAARVRDLNGLATGSTELGLRLYRPDIDTNALPCLLFFHGGGWVLNNLDTHDVLCHAICTSANIAVLSVDYRLAPENPYPAALDDAIAALHYAHAHAAALGIDPALIAVGGDSSGGNLAAVLALMARDGDVPPIRAQALLYPALDLSLTQASHRLAAQGLAVTGSTMRWFRDLYLRDAADANDWRVSPLRAASLANVAPCLLITAGIDPLRDEGLAYADRLSGEGNRMVHQHYPGQIHGFLSASVAAPMAARAFAGLTSFLCAEIGA